MAEPLRFHPLVVDDLETAANWYDATRLNSETDFRHTFRGWSRGLALVQFS